MQNLGFWILNDVIWLKTNPMPNFRGVRFTNAHETMIWAQKKKGAKYFFNHKAMKALNDDLQMRSDWLLPIATGKERLKSNGTKDHPTQKPEALLYRVLLSSTKVDDVVLDPFFGSGTTGAVAKKLKRNFIGIEKDRKYIEVAEKRIASVTGADDESLKVSPAKEKRIPFGYLIENGYLKIGQTLYFEKDNIIAKVLANGHIQCEEITGSIHYVAKMLLKGAPVNGWDVWYYKERGTLKSIDVLREKIRSQVKGLKDFD
jgi:modification methylase